MRFEFRSCVFFLLCSFSVFFFWVSPQWNRNGMSRFSAWHFFLNARNSGMKSLSGRPFPSSPTRSYPTAMSDGLGSWGPWAPEMLTCNPLRPALLELQALVQRVPHQFVGERSGSAVDDLEHAKVAVLLGLECPILVDDDVHDAGIIDLANAIVCPELIGPHKVGPDLGILDIVVHEVPEEQARVFPVHGLIVEQPLHHARPPVELLPGPGNG